jgi:hypothetical protein
MGGIGSKGRKSQQSKNQQQSYCPLPPNKSSDLTFIHITRLDNMQRKAFKNFGTVKN